MNGYLWILVIAVVAGLVWGLFEATVKGAIGEAKVAVSLSALSSKEYRILNNVMLATDKGTTQIDHVVVSVYGIFVIETKNYRGWITGGENSEQWIKNMYGKKYPFRNPLRQNYGHVKALQKLLGLDLNCFVSIVAFSSNATIKVKTNKHVIYISKIVKTIKQYREKMISENELDEMVAKISCANVDSKENRKVHVQNIRKKITDTKNDVKNGVCPKCGGRLVERKGKYGMFLGCDNYPRCKYTHDV